MEFRKIIRVGERSFGITLPKEWIELNGLEIGSPVAVIVDRNKITILPKSGKGEGHSVRVKCDNVEKLVRDIIAYYIEGVDEIEVETRNLSEAISKIEGKLPGVVLMEVGGVLKLRIVTREDIDIDEAVRSMYTTVDAMFQLFLKMLSEQKRSLVGEILRLDDQLDRLYFFSLRTVKRNIVQKPEHYVDYVIVIKNLEHIGDAIDRATNFYFQNDIKCLADVYTAFKKVHQFLQEAYAAFLQNKEDLALEVLLKRADLAKETLQSICQEAAAIMHEASSIVGYAADIAEAAYSRAVRR